MLIMSSPCLQYSSFLWSSAGLIFSRTEEGGRSVQTAKLHLDVGHHVVGLQQDVSIFLDDRLHVLDLIPDHQDTSEDIPTEFVLPGLPLLSKKLFSGGNMSGASSHRAEKLGKDLALYERKAAEFVEKMMAEAVSREETKLAVTDPLKFWLSQV